MRKTEVKVEAQSRKNRQAGRLTDQQIRAHLAATCEYFTNGQPVTQAHVDAARSLMDRSARGVKGNQIISGDFD